MRDPVNPIDHARQPRARLTTPYLAHPTHPSFKANRRNMKLLEAHLEQPRAARRADSCFLCGVFLICVVAPFTLVIALLGGIVVGILAAVGVIR